MEPVEKHPLSLDITFYDRTSPNPISTHAINIDLTTQDDTLQACRLTLRVSPETYKQIETQALFNLKPDIRGPFSNGEFAPDADYQIEVSLHPKLLPGLTEKASTAEEIANHLTQLQPAAASTDINLDNIDPLLQAENWFALSVRQLQGETETGYRTLWSYLDLALLNAADIDDESMSKQVAEQQLSEGMINFFKEQLEGTWADAAQNLENELMQGITEVFKDLGQSLTEDWENSTDNDAVETVESDTSIQAALLKFLDEEDWAYVHLNESALQLSVEGQQGRWHCQAHVREDQQQLIFYSFCPINAPEDKRNNLAELFTRINYTLAIGNFEMDFDDGEIRYRTSIDVEGDRLNSALIRQLVYANITTLDNYLPSLIAAIEGTSAGKALTQLIRETIPEQKVERRT